MPKIVDHEARRADIAQAAFRVVARKGIMQATVRDVAQEAGFSVGAIGHYLSSKDQILLAALEFGSRSMRGRMEAAAASAKGLEALRRVLYEALPSRPDMPSHWRIWFSLWELSHTNAAVRGALHDRYEESRWRYGGLIRAAQALGEVDPGVRIPEAATALICQVDGIGVHYLLAGRAVSHRQLTRQIDQWIEGFLVRPALSGTRSRRAS